jgi:hypothetical protein
LERFHIIEQLEGTLSLSPRYVFSDSIIQYQIDRSTVDELLKPSIKQLSVTFSNKQLV